MEGERDVNGSSDSPLVTVYIPSANYGRYLGMAVRSVITQLYRHWELFIVDEASTDDSLEIARAFQREHPGRIHVVANTTPNGLQRVANEVLRRAAGKYLVRLDADDWFDEGALLLMVAKLESDASLGLVFGNYYYTDAEGTVLGIERRARLGFEDNSGHVPPHGACTMVRTRSLRAVGGYSEDVTAQDGWQLWFKLSRRVGTASLDAPVFYYRQHGTSLSRDARRLLDARGKIFAQARRSLEGDYDPTVLLVIGVRESYPDFEGVPYRKYKGDTMLQRALKSADVPRAQIVVASESGSVLCYSETLESQGVVPKHRRLLRTPNLQPTVPIRDVLLEAGNHFASETGAPPDILAFLSIHAVGRRPAHVEKALDVLRVTESDSAVSVQREREPVFAHGTSGLRLVNPGRLEDLSYDREQLFRFNGAVIATWWEVLRQSLLGERIAYVEMSAAESIQIKTASMLGPTE